MHLILDAMADGLSYAQALGIQADWYEDQGIPLAAMALRSQGRIAAGWKHSLALTPEGQVVAWRSLEFQQFAVPANLRAVAIAAGWKHFLALTPKGRVIAWGDNNYNQCDVPTNLHAVAVAAGDCHSLAITTKGKVVAWGEPAINNATCRPTYAPSPSPQAVATPSPSPQRDG